MSINKSQGRRAVLALLCAIYAPLVFALDQSTPRVLGIFQAQRIQMTKFSYQRDWSFLDGEDDSDSVSINFSCGVRELEGVLNADESRRVKLLSYLGEFCDAGDSVRLRGASLVVTKRDSRGNLWLAANARIDEDLTEHGEVTIVEQDLEQVWLMKFLRGHKGRRAECKMDVGNCVRIKTSEFAEVRFRNE